MRFKFLLAGLLTLMTAFVAFQLALTLWLPGTPFIAFDSVDYFRRALEVFEVPTFSTLAGFERPLFCWWIPMLASRLSHPLGLAAFAVASNLWAFGTLIAGLLLYLAGRPQASLGLAWTLTLVLSIEPLRLLSLPHAFMGDLYLTGQVLLCEGLLSQLEARRSGSFRWAIAAGLAFAVGMQTKPIFFLWALPRTLFSALSMSSELAFRARSLAVFLLACGVGGWLLFPRRVPEFGRLLFLHSEIWKQHQLNPNPFWFLQELGSIAFRNGAAALVATGLVAFGIVGRFNLKKPGCWDPSLATIVFCALILSLFTVGKDFRTTQFLFVLSVAAAARWAAAGVETNRQFVIAAPATLVACMLAVARLSEGRWAPYSFEELGYERLTRVLVPDASAGGSHDEVSVYVAVNSMEYNYTSLQGYRRARCGLMREEELARCEAPMIRASSSPFSLGGWGEPGGFPRRFFTADYVVLPDPGGRPLDFFGGSLYAELIRARLISGDPAFSEGLREIVRLPAQLGIAWLVYKRERPISRGAFRTVLEEVLSGDPDNFWNEPWRIALERLKDPTFNPASPAEVERRRSILKRNADRIELNDPGHSLKGLLEGSKQELENARYPALVHGLVDSEASLGFGTHLALGTDEQAALK